MGTSTSNTVSVGKAGGERKVVNVAAGSIATASTDAVNGSQLYAAQQRVGAVESGLAQIAGGAGITYFHANAGATPIAASRSAISARDRPISDGLAGGT